MNLSDMRFPRQLEADGLDVLIRQALMVRTQKLWSGSRFEVPVVSLCDPLKKALKTARMQSRLRYGFEPVFEKLIAEKRGIAQVKSQTDAPYGDRISRLLILSNDGAERFNRQIDAVLQAHAPRVLCCILDIDGGALGHLITGKAGIIKIVMADHKDAVAAVLRSLVVVEPN